MKTNETPSFVDRNSLFPQKSHSNTWRTLLKQTAFYDHPHQYMHPMQERIPPLTKLERFLWFRHYIHQIVAPAHNTQNKLYSSSHSPSQYSSIKLSLKS